MKVAIAISVASLLALPAVSCAQDHTVASSGRAPREQTVAQQQAPEQDHSTSPEARRLESVTWNAVSHELAWTISKGEKVGNAFQARGKDSYLIKLDDATMSYNGETRRFSKQEASNVHVLMDLISKYAADSTIWWDEGQGERMDGSQGQPPQDKKKEVRNNGVMHIALRQPAPAAGGSLAELHAQIRRMERQLAELKQIERLLLSASPVQPAHF